MSASSGRGVGRVEFGGQRALVSPLKIAQEPDREEEPEVRIQTTGREGEQGLTKRRVRNILVGVSVSVLLGRGVNRWVVNSWKQEVDRWEGCH